MVSVEGESFEDGDFFDIPDAYLLVAVRRGEELAVGGECGPPLWDADVGIGEEGYCFQRVHLDERA